MAPTMEDEGLHPANDDVEWQESVYFAWRDAGGRPWWQPPDRQRGQPGHGQPVVRRLPRGRDSVPAQRRRSRAAKEWRATASPPGRSGSSTMASDSGSSSRRTAAGWTSCSRTRPTRSPCRVPTPSPARMARRGPSFRTISTRSCRAAGSVTLDGRTGGGQRVGLGVTTPGGSAIGTAFCRAGASGVPSAILAVPLRVDGRRQWQLLPPRFVDRGWEKLDVASASHAVARRRRLPALPVGRGPVLPGRWGNRATCVVQTIGGMLGVTRRRYGWESVGDVWVDGEPGGWGFLEANINPRNGDAPPAFALGDALDQRRDPDDP